MAEKQPKKRTGSRRNPADRARAKIQKQPPGEIALRAKPFHLILADDDIAAWMPITNTFIYQGGNWDRVTQLWEGVLFQFGKFSRVGSGDLEVLQDVTFVNSNSVIQTIPYSEIKNNTIWINIVARKNPVVRELPMQVSDLGLLYLLQANLRPLHNHLTPYPGGITFWVDREYGYELKANSRKHDDVTKLHFRYDFSCKMTKAFFVEVWKNGALVNSWTGSEVDTMNLNLIPGGDHGEHLGPPQRP